MILQVGANGRQMMAGLNPQCRQGRSIAKAGKLQEFWRSDGAGCDDDLAAGGKRFEHAVLAGLEAGDASVLSKDQPFGMDVALDARLGRLSAGRRYSALECERWPRRVLMS